MAKNNLNITSYKNLKKRSSNKKELKNINKESIAGLKKKLLPTKAPKDKGDANYKKLLGNIQNDYNSKIGSLKKDHSAEIKDREQEYKKTIGGLQGRLTGGEKRMKDLSDGVSKELERLYASQQKGLNTLSTNVEKSLDAQREADAKDKEETTQSNTPSVFANLSSDIDTTIQNEAQTETLVDSEKNKVTEEVTEDPVDTEEEEKMSEILDENGNPVPEYLVSKVLKLDEKIKIGDYTYRITNLYAPRVGDNSVSGRKSGSHPRAVDLVSEDDNGNIINYPVAVADGTIVNIGLQGSGNRINTSEGSEIGYYVDIRSGDKILRYGHLDAGIFSLKDDLLGTKVFRGDVLFAGGRATGSITGLHVKLYMSDVNADGSISKNYLDKGNDPSYAIKNGL